MGKVRLLARPMALMAHNRFSQADRTKHGGGALRWPGNRSLDGAIARLRKFVVGRTYRPPTFWGLQFG